MSSERAAEGLDPVEVLRDLPAPLWAPLLRTLRRAVDRLPRADLPAGLRPYAAWTPESLAAPRLRRAVAEAIAGDFRLREEVGEALDDAPALAAGSEIDGARLVDAHGEEAAVVALVAHGRWRDLAVLAAGVADRLARQDRSAGEEASGPSREELQAAYQRLSAALAAARDERDAQRRRADAAEERARREEAAGGALRAEVDRMAQRVAELEERLVEQRRAHGGRLARLHRRLAGAEARVRVDEARAAGIAGALERLAADLRQALEGPVTGEAPEPQNRTDERGPVAGVPRTVGPAVPGRPCRLPPGVAPDSAAAVQALLQVEALETVLDGYNVTKDARGRSQAPLADQRQWLVKHAGGIAARFGRRLTIVFDGTEEQAGPSPSARGVRVIFTAGEEIADDRVRDIVRGLDPRVPVLVVSSDREVQEAAEALGADIASAGAFLAATGA